MAGTFELYKDSADKYRFRLKASNGQVSPRVSPTRPRQAR
jgi:hypothetical protein